MSKRRQQIVVPVETKVRELDGKFLFALGAAEAGYDTVIGSQIELVSLIEELGPCIYVDKSFAATKLRGFRRLHAAGCLIAAWDEEGLVYFDAETYRFLRIQIPSLEMVDMVLGWGDHQADIVRRTPAPHPPVVATTGHPRFDFLRPELRSFFDEAVVALRQELGRIILVNTAFPFANHFLGDAGVADLFKKYPINENRPEFFPKWRDAQAGGLLAFRKAVPILATNFPEHRIVVRPHPSENRRTWQAFESEFDNVIVRAEGNVVEWILAAESVIQWDCCTGIEAFLLGRQPIALRDFESPGYEQLVPNALSHRVTSCDDLADCVRSVIDGTIPPLQEQPELYELARKHISNVDGPFAFERVLQALSDALPEMRTPSVEKVDPLRRAWRRWLKLCRGLRGRGPDAYDLQKFEGLTLSELEDKRAKLVAALGRFENIAIHERSRNVFSLRTAERSS